MRLVVENGFAVGNRRVTATIRKVDISIAAKYHHLFSSHFHGCCYFCLFSLKLVKFLV